MLRMAQAVVALLIQVQADCVRNDRGHLSHSHFTPVIPPRKADPPFPPTPSSALCSARQ